MATESMARQQLELLWQSFIMQSHGDGSTGFSFPLQQLSRISGDGLNELLNRYSALTNAPAAAHISGDMVHVTSGTSACMPPPLPGDMDLQSFTVDADSGTNRSNHVAQPRTKGKAKIPRPPNAFILYRQDNHPKLKSQYPHMHNNEISVRLGNQWKVEQEDIKEHYKAKAEEVKQQHLQNNPGYQYQPRKPSEKKRRMARGKNAVQARVTVRNDRLHTTTSNTPFTGSTVSDQSPRSAMTPTSQDSPHSYLEPQAQIYQDNTRQPALLEQAVVPNFSVSEFGMATYDMSVFTNDDHLDGMVRRFNVGKSPPHVQHSSLLHNVKPNDLSASERLHDIDLSSQIVHVASQRAATLAASGGMTRASNEGRATSTTSTGTFDFENYFDYDRLESDRNDSLEKEASIFKHQYLDEHPSMSSKVFD